MTEETWRPIPWFDDYQVSDSGRVVSFRRGKPRMLRLRAVKVCRAGNLPYLSVALYDASGRAERRVSELVLEAFVGHRPQGAVVRHLNSDPQDNRLENLAWGTEEQNTADRNERRTHCKRGHLLGGWSSNGHKRTRRCRTCRRERYLAKK